MYCFHCGCLLSEYDYCTACGADVKAYKKLVTTSNRLYNEGLEKAKVRDLTGAVACLKQSLKLNKSNIEARNLLGLVYFELGEAALAFCEWVISQNMRPEKNLASEYISMLQNNATRMDVIRQSIRKFNLALSYCQQGSQDMAVIQLKKVLSNNTRFVKAHQLLALLYIDGEDWEKAERELNKILDIDRGNTQALLYLQEVRHMLEPEEAEKKPVRRNSDDVVRYQRDNELIIQPLNVKEPKSAGFGTVLNIIIGLIIGLAAMYFLILPARVAQVTEEAQASVKEVADNMDSKTAEIQELNATITKLQNENNALEDVINGYTGEDGTLGNIDLLLDAASEYLTTGDVQTTAAKLETVADSVDFESMSDSFQLLYNTLLGLVGPQMSASLYTEGYEAYRNEDYTTAVELLERAVYYDETNADALFNLGNAYRRMENYEKATETFTLVTERFPGTERARRSQQYIDEIASLNQ